MFLASSLRATHQNKVFRARGPDAFDKVPAPAVGTTERRHSHHREALRDISSTVPTLYPSPIGTSGRLGRHGDSRVLVGDSGSFLRRRFRERCRFDRSLQRSGKE